MTVGGDWYGPHADPLDTIHKRVMMPVVYETNTIVCQSKVWTRTTGSIWLEVWANMKSELEGIVETQVKRFK